MLLDELPMIYTGCAFTYAITCHDVPANDDSASKYVISLYAVLVTVLYLFCQNPVFHQVAYGILVFKLVFDGWKISKKCSELRSIHLLTMFCYGLGFTLWNIDNLFCQSLRETRGRISIGPVLQLHSWWHFFTAYGTYLHIVLSTCARQRYLKRNFSVKMFGFHPYVQLD
ncbi:alkaline ceramidase 3-like [Styela clava]